MQSMIWLNLLLISSTCTHGEVPQRLVALWGQEQQLSVMHNQTWQPCNRHAPSILTVYLPKGGKVESITHNTSQALKQCNALRTWPDFNWEPVNPKSPLWRYLSTPPPKKISHTKDCWHALPWVWLSINSIKPHLKQGWPPAKAVTAEVVSPIFECDLLKLAQFDGIFLYPGVLTTVGNHHLYIRK